MVLAHQGSLPSLEHFNRTELCELIRRYTGAIVKRSLPKERLIELVETETQPQPDELAGTTQSRVRLQQFMEKHWGMIASQLPCSGPTKGKCSVHNCPDGRHIDCYMRAEPHIV